MNTFSQLKKCFTYWEHQSTLSARAKCREFLLLGYPTNILRYMCTVLQRDTGHVAWRTVRAQLDNLLDDNLVTPLSGFL